MSGSENIFLDTALFIYWLENHPVYYPKIEHYITKAIAEEARLVTSVLTYMEYSVKPEELGRNELIDDFLHLISSLNCPLIPVTMESAAKAYQLRAVYKSLKAIDAIQLATALVTGCQIFVTNDKRLRSVTELKVLTLDEIMV